MANQSPAIDIFNVLHHTPLVCVSRRKPLGTAILSLIPNTNSVTRNMKILSVLSQIDPNEQGLADVITAAFRLRGIRQDHFTEK